MSTSTSLAAAAGRSAESPVEALTRRLNGVLDADVRIRRIGEAPVGFDARFSAIWRRYAYRVADRPETVDPLTRGHVLTWPRSLDLESMNAASELSWESRTSPPSANGALEPPRSGRCSTWPGNASPRVSLVATVRADAFCHNMVRSLVGCLLSIGEGRQDPSWAAQVLTARKRDGAVKVAQAHGLTLEEVGYPEDAELAERARQARRLRGPAHR